MKYPSLSHTLVIVQFFLVCYFLYATQDLRKKSAKYDKRQTAILLRNEALNREIFLALEKQAGSRTFPPQIKHLPFADEEGMILGVREVDIPGVVAPYNASLIKEEGKYHLFFRYDVPVIGNEEVPFKTSIGHVELDGDFQPLAPYTKIDTRSDFSEDPRVLWNDGKCLLVYNDIVVDFPKARGIRSAVYDLKTKEVESITAFERRKFKIEKNWMPFVVDGKGLHFVYTISPHEVCHQSPSSTKMRSLNSNVIEELTDRDWSLMWGRPRGGTPPQLVDGEYLSFFHSMFEDAMGFVWYVMGAYTFEPVAPYRITKISSHPILFKGIFDAAHKHTANPKIRCLYPSGFVLEERDGREVLQVSCGENDSITKIITFDKEALFQSLKAVDKKNKL